MLGDERISHSPFWLKMATAFFKMSLSCSAIASARLKRRISTCPAATSLASSLTSLPCCFSWYRLRHFSSSPGVIPSSRSICPALLPLVSSSYSASILNSSVYVR